MTKDPFNSMLRRGLLPLPTGQGKDGWNDYGASDALAIVIAQQLAFQGAAQSQAQTWVSDQYAELVEYLTSRKTDRSREVFFGVAFLGGLGAVSSPPSATRPLFGTAKEIAAGLNSFRGGKRRASILAGHLTANVTYCMRLVWARSKTAADDGVDAELYLLADLLGIS